MILDKLIVYLILQPIFHFFQW